MSVTVFHLPAFVPAPECGQGALRMVSGCGRRGPIRLRDSEDRAPHLVIAPSQFRVCDSCAVAWDTAEATGQLTTVFTTSGMRSWSGAGAILSREEWEHRPQRGYAPSGQPYARDIIAMSRQVAPKRLRRAT